MGRVQGKIALVTGAGLGLGRAASLLLAEEGAAIFCTDISPEHSKETVRLIPREEQLTFMSSTCAIPANGPKQWKHWRNATDGWTFW
jgi:NAD(P)-dependent dehydrogenase (short-subunit alcohol dehydrogenase family)